MRSSYQRRAPLLLAAALGLAGGAWAQPAQITSELVVERVEIVDGKTVLHHYRQLFPPQRQFRAQRRTNLQRRQLRAGAAQYSGS